MKAIKTTIILLVLGAIGFFIWQWTAEVTIDKSSAVENVEEAKSFINKIENDIKNFKATPDEEFNKDQFKKIQSEIEYFYNVGDLGENSMQNSQNYNSLSKRLFAAFVP